MNTECFYFLDFTQVSSTYLEPKSFTFHLLHVKVGYGKSVAHPYFCTAPPPVRSLTVYKCDRGKAGSVVQGAVLL